MDQPRDPRSGDHRRTREERLEGVVRRMVERARFFSLGRRRVSVVAVLLIISSRIARAQYLDPGSGSFLFQAIVAGITILIFFFSRIRESLKRMTSRLMGKDPQE